MVNKIHSQSTTQKNPITPTRTIPILAIGIMLTMLPVTMIVPVLKELVSVRFRVAPFWAHAFMSTSLIGAIVFAPIAGAAIDRGIRRRTIFFISLTGNGLCFVAMALAPTFWFLMLARFIEGAMHITALSAWLATGADLSPQGRSGRVMGALGGMIMLGITIGVPLGGFIAGEEPLRVLWVAAFVSLLTALFALLAPDIHGILAPRPTTPLRALADLVHRTPRLAIPYLYSFIDRLCVGVVVSTLALYMTDILQLTPAKRGIELSFFLVPFALLAYPVGRLSDRIGRVGLMATGSVLFGLVFMTYGFADKSHMYLAMLASGLFSAMMYTPTLALCKDLSPPNQHGAVFAGYNIAGSLGFVIGPLLGGGVFSYFSRIDDVLTAYRYTFLITGSLEILCVLATIPFLVRMVAQKAIG